VRRYYTYRTFEGVQKSLYNSSTYAKLTDADYAKLVEAAVNKAAMSRSEFEQGLATQTESFKKLLSI
jgi:hypothetical protein